MKYSDLRILLDDIEKEDPVDMTGLVADKEGFKDLICNNVWEMYQLLWKTLPQEERETAMMAAMAKLILDNFTLNTRMQIAFQE